MFNECGLPGHKAPFYYNMTLAAIHLETMPKYVGGGELSVQGRQKTLKDTLYSECENIHQLGRKIYLSGVSLNLVKDALCLSVSQDGSEPRVYDTLWTWPLHFP